MSSSFFESENGSLEMRGDLDKRIAVKHLRDIINREDALKGDWLERSSQSFPKLPRQFQYMIKNPSMVKNALTAACNNLMAEAGVKLGHD